MSHMADRTPPYLREIYEQWFTDHPGARAEIATTPVRRLIGPGSRLSYVKVTPNGEITIGEPEFDARYWAREQEARSRHANPKPLKLLPV
jgi:hypothetical protein